MNFYYAKILQLCREHQNRIRMKEATDNAIMDIYEPVIEHNKKEPNPYEQYDDDYILSSSISSLGEHARERIDHKRANFRLWIQKNDTIEYHRMRSEFFTKVFVNRDMQSMTPMVNFMSEDDVREINEDLRREKQLLGKEITKPNKLFKELYARVYTEHYREIIEQIETYATYGAPIEKFLNYNDIDTVCYIDTGASTQENSRQPRSLFTRSTCTLVDQQELHYITSFFLNIYIYILKSIVYRTYRRGSGW